MVEKIKRELDPYKLHNFISKLSERSIAPKTLLMYFQAAKRFLEYCPFKGYRVVEIIVDIVSELKTDRRGLKKLFELVVSKHVEVMVVTYRNRLTKFSFEYLEYFFN